MKRKLPFWASLFTLTGVIILVSLGNWQINRLAWKAELLDKISAAYAQDAGKNPLNDSNWNTQLVFSRGFLKGRYRHDKEILIAPRTYEGAPGYHVLTPLQLSGDKGTIIVNRGWIPLDQNSPDAHWGRAIAHEVIVTGMIRRVPDVNMFVSENNIAKDEWYRIDLEQISAARELGVLIPYVFYAEEKEKSSAQDELSAMQKADKSRMSPLPAATKIQPNNNHKQYAFFWYAMALVLVVVFALRFLKRDA